MTEYRILAASFLVVLAVLVSPLTLAVFLIAHNLNGVRESILHLCSHVSTQTAQQSWLVQHYAKPVRPIYPWEKHRCEWCGQEKREGDK
jgi:hypothetical protein